MAEGAGVTAAEGDVVGGPVGCGVRVGDVGLVRGVGLGVGVGVGVGVARGVGLGVVAGGAVVGTGPVDGEGWRVRLMSPVGARGGKSQT